MRKTVKNILIVSDDFLYPKLTKKSCEPGDIYYNDDKNWLRFKIDIKKTFKVPRISKYDAILVDYGFIGRKEEAIELLQDAYTKGIPLAWVGGVPPRYNKDAQIVFPRMKFIHNLPTSSIDDEEILFLLYGMFGPKPKRVLKKQSKKKKVRKKLENDSSLEGLANLIMGKKR